MTNINRLFIYGPERFALYAPDYSSSALLRTVYNVIRFGKPGPQSILLRHKLYSFDQFAGIYETKKESDVVVGDLIEYEQDEINQILSVLDDPVEMPSIFNRSIVYVQTDKGDFRSAWTYHLPTKPSKNRLVRNGDWIVHEYGDKLETVNDYR